jgi:hypothetical protein
VIDGMNPKFAGATVWLDESLDRRHANSPF